jgi:hypothetical protein
MKLQIVLELPELENKIKEYKYILPSDISHIENGTCTEISLSNILDYIPERLEYLKLCIQKLRLHGKLSLSGLDILEISKTIVKGQMTIDEINKLLYNNKQSIDNIQRIIVFFANLNFTILEKRINNITYYIKVEKND